MYQSYRDKAPSYITIPNDKTADPNMKFQGISTGWITETPVKCNSKTINQKHVKLQIPSNVKYIDTWPNDAAPTNRLNITYEEGG